MTQKSNRKAVVCALLMVVVIMLAVFVLSGCTNHAIRIETSYLNDIAVSQSLNKANGSHRTGAEGLEGTKINVMFGGDILEKKMGDTTLTLSGFFGPSVIMPNGTNYGGSLIHSDDAWGGGVMGKAVAALRFGDFPVEPFAAFGAGAFYTHHQWDGQGTNYLFDLNPEVGLQIPTKIATFALSYGLDHFSNAKGRTRTSNGGRNTDIFTFTVNIPFGGHDDNE